MKILKYFACLLLSISLLIPTYADGKPLDAKAEKVIKMEDVKQKLLGLDKEYNPGDFVKVKISPLPASSNPFTAVYKIALLENGKISDNCEIVTKTQKSGDPVNPGSDFAFSARNSGLKYQVLFAATYVEYKPGTAEVVSIYNPDVVIYDVKIAGYVPPAPIDIPEGTFGLIRSVYMEAAKISVDADKKLKLFTNLSNTFSGMSSKIAAGVYKDSDVEADQTKKLEDFLKETKTSVNSAIAEAGVDPKVLDGNVDVVVKSVLEKLYDAGKMRKFVDYQGAWAEIAEAFRLAIKAQK